MLHLCKEPVQGVFTTGIERDKAWQDWNPQLLDHWRELYGCAAAIANAVITQINGSKCDAMIEILFFPKCDAITRAIYF